MKKIVWIYNPITFQLIGEYAAPKSPAEPGDFLLPVDCLQIAPPAVEAGKAIIASDGAWVLVNDVRGIWYQPDGQVVELLNLTDMPESDWTREPPISPDLIPSEVSILQAEEALAHFGYLQSVEAIMSSPATPENHKRAWKRASSVRRDSAIVAAMAGALELADSDLDALFTYAAGVTA